MMRKILMLLAVAGAVALAPPQAAYAAAKPTEQELLLIKKKKAEAARKAAAKKQEARRIAERNKKQARKRDCSGLLDCLFGSRTSQKKTISTSRGAIVDYATAEDISWSQARKYAVGSIIVNTPERSLYYVTGDGTARRYKVGVGREGFQWSGSSRIVNKAEWPTWRPPQVMIEREAAKGHILPVVMDGGPENPLGARAMYIGGTMYRIHGTNNAASIGGAVSSGCIRMMNTDVMDLYQRVEIGAKVYVFQ
jgi:lipoprotein-anchoring transpeptidase ErfK/SrfK